MSIDLKRVTDVICPETAEAECEDSKCGAKSFFTYSSKTTGTTRGAGILLPANYDTSKEYPVLYFLHGIFGDEYCLINDTNNKIPEILCNLKEAGNIGDVIVVFPNMYATTVQDGKPVMGKIDNETIAPYDNFINDLVNDLIPYVESHFSVSRDRAKRGLIGFSLGGRETLFIGTRRSDLFSCIGAVSPAPGLTPGRDWAMEHPGQLKEDELVVVQKDRYPLDLIMITCGTKDGVVGKFPESYHNILTTNGVEHLWYEVPDADHNSIAIKSGFYNYLIRWWETMNK